MRVCDHEQPPALGRRSEWQHQFWQADNHPIDLYTLPVIAQKIGYIHLNPVKEGWVEQAEHYLYSSATNYATGTGLLDVAVVDLPMTFAGEPTPCSRRAYFFAKNIFQVKEKQGSCVARSETNIHSP